MLKKTSINNKRLAVIDLGSNTFHLLIVEKQNNKAPYFKTIFRKREFVFVLGENYKQIGQEEQLRAIDCIRSFDKIINELSVDIVIPAATAAFRMAKNGQKILSKLEQILDVPISIFTGQQEAHFIFKGISLMPKRFDANILIMDIGGGSVELILSENKTLKFADSFKAGISFIRNNFRISDIITSEEKEIIYNYLDNNIKSFFNKIKNESPTQLVGSSGPFEILEKLTDAEPSITGNIFNRQQVLIIAQKITSSSKSERQAIKGMPADRSDLSKESFLLVEYLLNSLPSIEEICVSPFSLKEGIIAEQLNLE